MPGEWFENLRKPTWNPPDFVFAPVWTVLYILMAISFGLILKSQSPTQAKLPIVLFIFQLIFNAVWSFLFFGLKNPGLAFADIVVLWILIAATIYQFFLINKLAAYLLIPYILWVTFAGFLNFTIWRLNM